MKGNIGQLMKQAQMMQENMRRMQESLGTMEVEGQSGAGMVKVQMSCKHEVKRVSIDPSLFGDDREMLEPEVVAAGLRGNGPSRHLPQNNMFAAEAHSRGRPIRGAIVLPHKVECLVERHRAV